MKEVRDQEKLSLKNINNFKSNDNFSLDLLREKIDLKGSLNFAGNICCLH